MVDHNKPTTDSGALGFSRRSVLKATGATTVGAVLFSGTASATDDGASFRIECLGDEVKVTLTGVEPGDGLTPAQLETDRNLQIYLGTRENVDVNNPNGRIDAIAEIEPCFFDENTKSDAFCADVAFPQRREIVGDSVCYFFDRNEAGLDEEILDPNSVVIAGVYDSPDGDIRDGTVQTFDSLGGRNESKNIVEFDPSTCCIECESGEELLVKYEYDEEKGEFFIEKGGDDDITLESVTLDDEGEPEEACFSTTYCELDAVVKAGPGYEVTDVSDTEFCVTGIEGKAISNIRFYCVAPDDLSVGNGNGNRKGKGK